MCWPATTFSILERIELGETSGTGCTGSRARCLSVSSNGSNWVKPTRDARLGRGRFAFSILERIELGETGKGPPICMAMSHLSVSSNGSNWVKPFSATSSGQGFRLLSVSSNGSNWVKLSPPPACSNSEALSVSSNGSNWVKLGEKVALSAEFQFDFQYPRTDRIG